MSGKHPIPVDWRAMNIFRNQCTTARDHSPPEFRVMRYGAVPFFKAGAAIRTPDLHVGNRGVSDQKRALDVSSRVDPMRLVQLVRVDA